MSIKIYIVRHGHSLGNLTKTFLGHVDLDLSELGYKQAECTAKALKNIKIDAIYSSDLSRALNTALKIANFHNIKVITSDKLREVNAGEWEGLSVDSIIERWGREEFYDKWVNDFGNYQFPSGESICVATERFYSELCRICDKKAGKEIVICTHAAVLRGFWAKISNISYDNIAKTIPFSTNASYSIVEYNNGVFIPVEYSIDDHLNEIGITKVNLM